MGRVSLIACPPPAFLCFTSWWRENENGKSVRREVKLKYDTSNGSVTLCLNKVTSTQYRLSHMEGKFGPVEAIDLYVGAQLRVLGRVLTLRQADSPTVHWLEAESDGLRELARRDAEEWGELYCGGMIEKSIRQVIAGGRDGKVDPP